MLKLIVTYPTCKSSIADVYLSYRYAFNDTVRGWGHYIKSVNIRGKLGPRYIGHYKVIKKSNLVAYKLDLLVELENVHCIFRISQNRKYAPYPNHSIVVEPIKVAQNLVYEEHPMQILDYRLKQPHNKGIPLVKFYGLITPHRRPHGTLKKIGTINFLTRYVVK